MVSLRDSLTYEPKEMGFGTSGLRDLVTVMTDLECYINTLGFLDFLLSHDLINSGDVVYVAGDLRDSTPRITKAVMKAITDGGYQVEYNGLVPTPALAYRSFGRGAGIMVTGSHIPADRNGIKFNKPEGEVLKPDEIHIHEAVAKVRQRLYAEAFETSAFDENGMLKQAPQIPETTDVGAAYRERYTKVFAGQPLAGRKVVFYQHSAVGRDLLVELLGELGAEVVPVGRSEVFIPIDSENVKPEHQTYFRQLAQENPGLFAIVSTDGDSDRPFVVDETGEFHRGDVLGAVVAHWLSADFAAYPISNSDASDIWLGNQGVPVTHTKIGSPFVIAAMNEARAQGKHNVVGWEANGGFLIGSELTINGQTLSPLATRDAILPIIVAMVVAIETQVSISELFAKLPARFTSSGLIDNFPPETYKVILEQLAHDTPEAKTKLAAFFTSEKGFGEIEKVNTLDGVRLYFANGDIAHLRQSSNAPQLRIYSVAGTQERADEIASLALAEPDGIFRTIQRQMSAISGIIE